jgi:hypothetical protein
VSDADGKTREKRGPRWGRRILTGLILLSLAGVGGLILRQLPLTNRFYTDADTIREPADTALTRDILWQPVRPLEDLINTDLDDYEPRLSADGMTLYFVRGKAGNNSDIYTSLRSPEGWSEPQPLADINSDFDDLGPEPSSDGQSLYFYSDRPGGLGGYDLWVSYKGSEGWQPPLNLGPAANSEFNDYGPALTPDGRTLYFASNRPQQTDRDVPDPNAWSATLREDLYFRDYDLYMTSVTESGIGTAAPIAALNTNFNDGAPAVSSFGDFLYFASDRPGGRGGFDLYRSRRLRGGHESPTNLGPTINTIANELDAGLSLGGYALYFSSDRAADDSDTFDSREYNLYYSTSREVFADTERVDRPPINWAAIWSQIGPNLLWALLALLLLLALWALLRDARSRRLSLLAKCLLASFIAHLLLMILFNLWEVTSTLAREFHRRGRIQIALASPAQGNDLSSQILSGLTEVEAVAPPEAVSERHRSQMEMQPAQAAATLDLPHEPIEFSDLSRTTVDTTEAAPDAPERPREPEPTIPTTVSLVDLQMEMPTESTRERTSEATLVPVPTEQTANLTPRRALAADMAHSADAVARLTPSTSDDAAGKWEVERQSLAGSTRPHDAEVSESGASAPPSTSTDANRMRVIEIPLSALESQTAAQVAELTQLPETTLSPTARLGISNDAAADHARPTAFQVEPRNAPQSREDSPLAHAVEQTLTDAIPNAASALRTAVGDIGVSELPAVDVMVATPVQTPESALGEQEPTRPAPVLQDLRLHETPEEPSLSARAGMAALRPTAVDDEFAQTSFAVTAQPNATEAPTASPAPASAPSGLLVATLPEPTDILLPSLEQSTYSQVAEATVSVNSQKASHLRVETAPYPMPATPQSTQLVSQVRPLTRRMVNNEPITPSSTMPNDYSGDSADGEPILLASRSPVSRDLDAMRLDVDLPTETAPPEDPYVQRTAPDRLSLVERLGGSAETEQAVADALRWLAEHQSDDGHWDGDAFDDGCHQCGGETSVVVDHALTGLALLSFLGAGHTHADDGPYRETVERGLRWLVARQQVNGDLRGEETMYTQGIATIALSEAFGMTGDRSLAESIRRAARFIDRARNRDVGGWRYDPGQVGDTSVLGWQVMALKSASINGIAVPAASFGAAKEWLDLVTPSPNSGLYAYQPRREPTPPMTAEAMFSQQLLGVPRDHPRMQASAAYLSNYPPDWDAGPNTYYWYYATLALFQHQGEVWENWNRRLTRQLIEHQRKDGPAMGSWDPVGEWADIGGRVYQTAICALTLEVYYRYLPLYTREEAVAPIGSIRGTVSDASSGLVLPGAAIRLDLPDRAAVTATTGPDGIYTLATPEVPDFFALSASKEGHVPSSANVSAAMVRGNILYLDFDLMPIDDQSVAVEPVPDVHHLGDNKFDGTINSQFQKESEGSEFAASFELTRGQLGPHDGSAEVRLLAKGVQRAHKIRINGTVLDQRLDDAPEDGSFGEFSARFDLGILREGTNTFEIIAKPSTSDIDDFEFVNVQIHFLP